MNDETSPLVESVSVTMVIKARRKNGNDDYSSVASSVSQATVAATGNSSPLNNGEEIEEKTESDGVLVMNIEEAIDRLGLGMFQFQIILACGLCFASDAMEILLLSFLRLILQSEWNLSGGRSDSIVSVVFFGAMMGTLILTPLGDRLGRRPIFAVTAATISLFGVLTAFCTTYFQLVMVRFMVGFGVGGLTVPYDALGEFMPSTRRGSNMLSTSFFWTASSLLVPLFAWLTLRASDDDNNPGDKSSEEGSWRAFVMLCSLPSIVSTVLGICFVPESPRWLLTRGEHEKSLRILRQAAAKNGKDPFLAFPEGTRLVDYNDGTKEIFEDNESSSCTVNDGNYDSISDPRSRDNITNGGQEELQPHNNDETNNCAEFVVNTENDRYCLMCWNPHWRRISILLGGQWFGLAFMYYGAIMAVSIVFSNIQKNDSDTDKNEGSFNVDYGAIFITSSAEAVGLTLAILIVDRVGRVSTQVWTYLLGGFCLLLLGILDFYLQEDILNGGDQEEEELRRPYLIVFAFLSRMLIMAATSVTWLHTAELLPTRFRATGHGLANAMGRIGGIVCPYVVSRDTSLRTIGFVMFSVSVVTSICIKYLPETNGKALGIFDVSLKETQEQPIFPSFGHQVSRSNNNAPPCGEDQIREDDDEQIVSSFEII